MIFKCCMNCEQPKRHPGCHDHCPEYKEIRADYDRRKSIENSKKAVSANLTAQKQNGIDRAIKKKRGL